MVLAEQNKKLLAHQVNALQSRLESIDLVEFEADHAELLLWMASTGAMATVDEEDSAWFGGVAGRVARRLEVVTLEDMEERLFGWLYMGEVQRGGL